MKAGWKTVKLGEVCEVLDYKRRPVTKADRRAGPYPYYGATGVQDYVDQFIFDESLVLLGEDGAKWKSGDRSAFQVSGKTWVNNHAHVIRPNREVITDEWLVFWLNHSDLTEFVTGVTVPKLNQANMLKIPVELPPLAEQKRIVALLDEAFAGIDTLSSNAKTRSSEALCVFEQESDSFFANPDNKYTETTISDITTRLQYGTSEKSASTGRYVVLRMGNIQDGEIDYEDLKYTSSQEVIDQYSLKPGDVLFNRTNSPQWVGKSAIYRGEMPAVFAGYNIKIHTIADKIDSEFLTFFLNSDRAMSFGRSTFISSVNQANINAEKLRSYRLPLPPLREQKAIADRLGQIRKMSRALAAIYQKSLAQSEHLKAAILRSAFNGTL